MPTRRTAIALVAAVVAVGAIAIAVVGPSGSDDAPVSDDAASSTPSVPAADARDAEADDGFVVGATDEAHRIDYRVEDPTGAVPPTLDQVLVDPPFRSRLEIHPPGGGTPSLQIGTIDRLLVLDAADPASQPLVVARVPALAPAASRIAPVVDDAIETGVLERRGQRIVAGRRCQVFRTATLLEAGPLRPLGADDFVDTCVDAHGLVLEEVSVAGGEPVLVRTAVVVAPVEPADELFETGPVSAPPEQGGGATTPAEPDTAPEGPVFELPAAAVPPGFGPVGRFSVIPPQPERFEDPALRDAIIAGIADVWQRGGDLLVIYQGRTLGGVDAFEPVEFATPLASAVLGDGTRLLSALGTELRFPRPGGRFVHVFGTLPPDRLLDVADALVESQGTGLVLVDG